MNKQTSIFSTHKICVAPMLDWSDRHCRYFHRLISRHAVLYTEMVTTGALLNGDVDRHLGFAPQEHPVALQLGGSSIQDLAICSKMAQDYGYDEVNLNVGCPSDRVQNGRFGACLMAEPDLVAECVSAMQQAVTIPVTVKSRIGIDDKDSYQELACFIKKVAQGGCTTFIIHARKAWLSGLSPKQNREVPPLRYDVVRQIKQDFPELEIIINGGITSLEQSVELLSNVDGVMIGREAYHNPYILAGVDSMIYQQAGESIVRHEVARAMLPYIQQQLATGVRLHSITRHMLGLFHGIKGARAWRRHLSEQGPKAGADEGVVLQALELVQV
ncbi:tRNA-dihydrouridine synthase A [Bathymodiolus platifrons methanotrophic gill symbiont]|uniref:tRNA dihydrouridine(20/20a) synthase DusA n=1 Tax=Bathymodiolus platifrons methanotrophic gill symbiont TaxID=113268 RepID=UPI000B40C47D|nr:tRNA dihydrouridine(20/20a) synthase DusA [Bathymodiolus platifrons methanotrophic gill symbiont]MCK5870333.1 tRNA dihydrouridine(20/20a) synthase DusA [Methyloprofundus sp.]TXK96315.1 tRNA dihydrouridine(20/20a) synthase DusA [Methylococcaceae bacterium CS4]TXK97597.1 tRNA dihydrouridine(20/20a) synthase DusA [Methylococcaceae bacterium CS5]TXL05241.1 tRNA dihydrouridine(20/20a) synthase DusA [Methylococcaceae bacterium CS1]TXL05622.1 tRNA dihydrouridine(20/20a) synthase DusA [Methylococca